MISACYINRHRWPFFVFHVAISPSGEQLLVFHNTNFFIPTLVPSKHQVSLCNIRNQEVLWTATIQRRFVYRLMFSPEGAPVVLHQSGYYSVYNQDGQETTKKLEIGGAMRDAIMVGNEVFAINRHGKWCIGNRVGIFEPQSLFDSERVTASIAPGGEMIAAMDPYSRQLHIQLMETNKTQMVDFPDKIEDIASIEHRQILVLTVSGDCFLVALGEDGEAAEVTKLISIDDYNPVGTEGIKRIDSVNDGSLFILYTLRQKPILNIFEKEGGKYKVTRVDCRPQLDRDEHSGFSEVVCSETKDLCAWASSFRKLGIVKKKEGAWVSESSF
ncbi:hypothetical protein [Gimesia algae]|uniref:hypothetical protein n=1 Tax=Gimesia algae TaxID=2527971 RepID=UPI0011A8B093|nr:hypothetical protein [Gimesia algae]